jgi:hypothetical protein
MSTIRYDCTGVDMDIVDMALTLAILIQYLYTISERYSELLTLELYECNSAVL